MTYLQCPPEPNCCVLSGHLLSLGQHMWSKHRCVGSVFAGWTWVQNFCTSDSVIDQDWLERSDVFQGRAAVPEASWSQPLESLQNYHLVPPSLMPHLSACGLGPGNSQGPFITRWKLVGVLQKLRGISQTCQDSKVWVINRPKLLRWVLLWGYFLYVSLFMYCIIQSFKGCKLIFSNILTGLCNHYHCLILEHFHSD